MKSMGQGNRTSIPYDRSRFTAKVVDPVTLQVLGRPGGHLFVGFNEIETLKRYYRRNLSSVIGKSRTRFPVA